MPNMDWNNWLSFVLVVLVAMSVWLCSANPAPSWDGEHCPYFDSCRYDSDCNGLYGCNNLTCYDWVNSTKICL